MVLKALFESRPCMTQIIRHVDSNHNFVWLKSWTNPQFWNSIWECVTRVISWLYSNHLTRVMTQIKRANFDFFSSRFCHIPKFALPFSSFHPTFDLRFIYIHSCFIQCIIHLCWDLLIAHHRFKACGLQRWGLFMDQTLEVWHGSSYAHNGNQTLIA